MLKVKVRNINNRKTLVWTFMPVLIVSMIMSVVSGSLAVADPATIASAGVYQYFPSAPNDSYVDVTVPPKEAGATLPNIVSIIIPQRATSGPATFIFTSFSSNVETANGFFAVKVSLFDAGALPLAFVSGGYEIKFPQNNSSAALYSSRDGSTWVKIPESSIEFLPAEFHSIFFHEWDDTYSVITDQLGLFGFRQPQGALKISSKAFTLEALLSQTLTVAGGNGNGTIDFATTTSAICSVTSSGVVTGLKTGNCLITAHKFGAGEYIDVFSNTLSITVNASAPAIATSLVSATKSSCDSISYTFSTSAKAVAAGFCPKDVGKSATLYVRTRTSTGKFIDKKVAIVKIDSLGNAVFNVSQAISSSPDLHIFVNGVLWI